MSQIKEFANLYPEKYAEIKQNFDDWAYVKDSKGLLVEVPKVTKSTKTTKKKPYIAAKARSLKQPKQRSILAPPEKFPRKTEITERVRDTAAYKGASEEAKKTIDNPKTPSPFSAICARA